MHKTYRERYWAQPATCILSNIRFKKNPEIKLCLNTDILSVPQCHLSVLPFSLAVWWWLTRNPAQLLSHSESKMEPCRACRQPFFLLNQLGSSANSMLLETCFSHLFFLLPFFLGYFDLVSDHIFKSHLWLSVIPNLGNCCWLVHDHLLRHLDSHCCYCKNS